MIPIVVVAHPDRREMAETLAAQVQAQIRWDTGSELLSHKARCAANHIGALKSLRDTPSEWVAVLEDDAVPVPDFREHLNHALEYAPSPFVGLYLGTSSASETQQRIGEAVGAAKEQNKAWIMSDCLIGSVGYAVETHLLDDILGFIADRDVQLPTLAYQAVQELPLRITRWAQDRNVAICYTQPSLVDHADSDSIGKPWRGPGYPQRKAWNYGTRPCWCTGSVQLGYCPTWSAPRTENK